MYNNDFKVLLEGWNNYQRDLQQEEDLKRLNEAISKVEDILYLHYYYNINEGKDDEGFLSKLKRKFGPKIAAALILVAANNIASATPSGGLSNQGAKAAKTAIASVDNPEIQGAEKVYDQLDPSVQEEINDIADDLNDFDLNRLNRLVGKDNHYNEKTNTYEFPPVEITPLNKTIISLEHIKNATKNTKDSKKRIMHMGAKTLLKTLKNAEKSGLKAKKASESSKEVKQLLKQLDSGDDTAIEKIEDLLSAAQTGEIKSEIIKGLKELLKNKSINQSDFDRILNDLKSWDEVNNYEELASIISGNNGILGAIIHQAYGVYDISDTI